MNALTGPESGSAEISINSVSNEIGSSAGALPLTASAGAAALAVENASGTRADKASVTKPVRASGRNEDDASDAVLGPTFAVATGAAIAEL